MNENPALAAALIVLLGAAAQWLSWWMKLPAILLLLITGLLIGPGFQLFDPDAMFGDLLFPFVSLGVAVILFEGSLTLKFEEIRGHGQIVTRLVTIGALSTILVAALGAWGLGLLSWEVALLFGALVSVTGPTVIIPILRSVGLSKNAANILRWEGIIIDPLGALAAVVIFQFVAIDAADPGNLLLVFEILAAGTVLGAGAGYAFGWLLRRHVLPDYLHNVAALALVLAVFVASNEIAHESGLLAVTVMGIFLANMRDVDVVDILDFKESLTVLLTSILFIVLAARLPIEAFTANWTMVAALMGIILFIARPLSIFISTIWTPLPWRERAVLSWIAPRGIVAAAVSALFAIQLNRSGVEGAQTLVSLTFTVIVTTVLLQSLTARPLARLLGVADPEPRGILIVGGNPVALAIATSLHKLDFDVVLADTSWDLTRKARMAGIRTYFGNVVSDNADRRLDLVGIGRLLALSTRAPLNTLACLRYAREFGSGSVFRIRLADQAENVAAIEGRILFKEGTTLEKLQALLEQGWQIKVTKLTEEYGFKEAMEQQDGDAIPLYAVSRDRVVHPFADDRTFKAGPGWQVANLVKPPTDKTDQESSAVEQAKADLDKEMKPKLPD
ncbi:MAG: sodium:proton antiporter [Parvibaculum sp.]|jgi:NhaP-type Na+/H+ or K+/H+ antiporter|uniref:cation:proton antiporter n=1 Tax=Parvibaculum sp. TaxID=2024848 RepID=UPI000C5BD797|nr:sodium:proton antiporter [Parvibaculum sp.]MAU62216.1 sodium:proton antiporter [Parvibaculum sp.]HAC57786.1 sodium:proton antiporter [Rhodobiaceae bacterium]|tara:strand:+ start:1323 stop:3173 length:1851 start_codon:yes stop_codon:yes gene_type:complete